MRALRRILMILGALTLVLGLLAGVADRQALDTSRFVEHADRVRQDPAVSRGVAVALSDRILQAQPDLVAVRPLLEGALQAAVRSPAFGPLFRTAVAPLHQALTDQAPPTVVLRIADVGAVLVAATRTVAPAVAARVPSDAEVRLARLGSGDAGRHAVSGLRAVRLLSWLGPLLSLLCFGGAVALARGRRRAALHAVGLTVGAAGLGLALLAVLAAYLLDRLLPDTLGGALAGAGWRELGPSVRLTALLAAAAGYLLVLGTRTSARGLAAVTGIDGLGTGVRAGAVTAVGVVLVLAPRGTLTVLAVAAGLVLVLHGATVLARLAAGALAPRLARWRGRWGARWNTRRRGAGAKGGAGVGGAVALVLALAVLVGVVVWNSGGSTAPGPLRTADSRACNGSVELCGRRYDQVSFPGTHNSMAAADQPGWFLAEQPDGLIDQLDAGIRVFLIDTWYGQGTSRPGVIANTDQDQATALAQARADYGPDVLASALRLRRAAGLQPQGPTAPYLCHALCVLGSTSWEPLMARVAGWLDEHPREVLTFILQDEVSPATTAQVLDAAGLLPEVYTPAADGSWPTLEQMIDSGHRVVVMAENQGGGARYPWLLPAFRVVQDTPYDARRVADFRCRLNRGPATAPLFLVNHWLNRPLRVSASRQANSDAVLGARLSTCARERGRLPNFVAVDNYDQGDLFGQVRRLNGLGP